MQTSDVQQRNTRVCPESLGGKVETLLLTEALSAVLCSSLNAIRFRLKCCSYSNRFISFVRFFLTGRSHKSHHAFVAGLKDPKWILRSTGNSAALRLESTRIASLDASKSRHQKLKFITTLKSALYRINVNWNRGMAELMQMRVIMKILHVRFSFCTRGIWSNMSSPVQWWSHFKWMLIE